jgi:type IV pilus assembly protein PilC
MNDLTIATIIAILLLVAVAGGIYLVARLKKMQWTYVDTLVSLCFGFFFILGILRIGEVPDFLAMGILFTALVFVVALFWLLIQALFFVPRVDKVVRSGWIKIWPQVITRRKINKAVLDHARAITRLNLPLAEGFFLAGQQTPGRSGVVLGAMATFLHQGLKLSEAYSRYKARDALILSMMQVGERCGQLPNVLDHLQKHFDREWKQRRQRWVPLWWPYPVVMLTVSSLIVMFVMVVVVPKYETIFKDFGTTLPIPTQILIGIANVMFCKGVPIWFGLAILVGIIVYFRLQPRRYPQPRLYDRVMDRLIWRIPGVGAKREYTDLGHAAAVLRLALTAGMTMPEAVQCAADLDLHIVLRKRFQRFQELLAQGVPTEQAGLKVDLPPRFLWALRDGQDREMSQASLGLIENYYGLVAAHWYLTLNAMVWPVVVVALGLMVGFIDLALFLPLVKLIRATIPL